MFKLRRIHGRASALPPPTFSLHLSSFSFDSPLSSLFFLCCLPSHFEATTRPWRSSFYHYGLPMTPKAMAGCLARDGWLDQMSAQPVEQERALQALFEDAKSHDRSTRCDRGVAARPAGRRNDWLDCLIGRPPVMLQIETRLCSIQLASTSLAPDGALCFEHDEVQCCDNRNIGQRSPS